MKNNEETITIEKTFPLATYQTKDVIWTLGLTFAAVIFPAILAHAPQNQWVTGTIVNAILFIAVWRVGIINTTLVAALPSSVALLRGLLPAPMAILIPYIILSNFIMIAVFYLLYRTHLTAMIIASFTKFLFLLAITSYFVKVATSLVQMMQWPQLFTALAGGLIAVGFIKLYENKKS